jgi:hypothetical protein
MSGPDDDDPLLKYGAPLAAVLIAIIVSMMLAATVAGQLEADYQTRAVVYTAAVLWVLAGAAVLFLLAHRGESGRLSVGRVLLWTISIWLWPLFLLWRQRPADKD